MKMDIDEAADKYHTVLENNSMSQVPALTKVVASLILHLKNNGHIEEVLFRKLSELVNNILQRGVTESESPMLQELGAKVYLNVKFEIFDSKIQILTTKNFSCLWKDLQCMPTNS